MVRGKTGASPRTAASPRAGGVLDAPAAITTAATSTSPGTCPTAAHRARHERRFHILKDPFPPGEDDLQGSDEDRREDAADRRERRRQLRVAEKRQRKQIPRQEANDALQRKLSPFGGGDEEDSVAARVQPPLRPPKTPTGVPAKKPKIEVVVPQPQVELELEIQAEVEEAMPRRRPVIVYAPQGRIRHRMETELNFPRELYRFNRTEMLGDQLQLKVLDQHQHQESRSRRELRDLCAEVGGYVGLPARFVHFAEEIKLEVDDIEAEFVSEMVEYKLLKERDEVYATLVLSLREHKKAVAAAAKEKAAKEKVAKKLQVVDKENNIKGKAAGADDVGKELEQVWELVALPPPIPPIDELRPKLHRGTETCETWPQVFTRLKKEHFFSSTSTHEKRVEVLGRFAEQEQEEAPEDLQDELLRRLEDEDLYILTHMVERLGGKGFFPADLRDGNDMNLCEWFFSRSRFASLVKVVLGRGFVASHALNNNRAAAVMHDLGKGGAGGRAGGAAGRGATKGAGGAAHHLPLHASQDAWSGFLVGSFVYVTSAHALTWDERAEVLRHLLARRGKFVNEMVSLDHGWLSNYGSAKCRIVGPALTHALRQEPRRVWPFLSSSSGQHKRGGSASRAAGSSFRTSTSSAIGEDDEAARRTSYQGASSNSNVASSMKLSDLISAPVLLAPPGGDPSHLRGPSRASAAMAEAMAAGAQGDERMSAAELAPPFNVSPGRQAPQLMRQSATTEQLEIVGSVPIKSLYRGRWRRDEQDGWLEFLRVLINNEIDSDIEPPQHIASPSGAAKMPRDQHQHHIYSPTSPSQTRSSSKDFNLQQPVDLCLAEHSTGMPPLCFAARRDMAEVVEMIVQRAEETGCLSRVVNCEVRYSSNLSDLVFGTKDKDAAKAGAKARAMAAEVVTYNADALPAAPAERATATGRGAGVDSRWTTSSGVAFHPLNRATSSKLPVVVPMKMLFTVLYSVPSTDNYAQEHSGESRLTKPEDINSAGNKLFSFSDLSPQRIVDAIMSDEPSRPLAANKQLPQKSKKIAEQVEQERPKTFLSRNAHDGYTPLMFAVQFGAYSVAEILLETNVADVCHTAQDGHNALTLAVNDVGREVCADYGIPDLKRYDPLVTSCPGLVIAATDMRGGGVQDVDLTRKTPPCGVNAVVVDAWECGRLHFSHSRSLLEAGFLKQKKVREARGEILKLLLESTGVIGGSRMWHEKWLRQLLRRACDGGVSVACAKTVLANVDAGYKKNRSEGGQGGRGGTTAAPLLVLQSAPTFAQQALPEAETALRRMDDLYVQLNKLRSSRTSSASDQQGGTTSYVPALLREVISARENQTEIVAFLSEYAARDKIRAGATVSSTEQPASACTCCASGREGK